MDDLSSSDFSTYHISMPHRGVFPISVKIYRFPHWFAWSPSILRYISGWWFDFIVSWYSVEPLLSLSARFTFSDIVVILGRSYLRRVDSRVTISVEHNVLVFYYPTSQDYSVDCYVEIVVCLLPNYSLRLYRIIRSGWRWILPAEHYELEEFGLLWHSDRPCDFIEQVIRLCSPSTRSFWLASRASFGTHGVSSRPFRLVEGCSSMLHWGISPSSSFPCNPGIQHHRTFSVYGIQSHPFPAWRSEPPCVSQLDVHSYHWRSQPLFLLGIHDIIFSLAFRATISSQFGIRSHVRSSAFKVII